MDDLSKPGKTNIAERMRALAAQRDDLPDNWDELADKVDAATVGFFCKTTNSQCNAIHGVHGARSQGLVRCYRRAAGMITRQEGFANETNVAP